MEGFVKEFGRALLIGAPLTLQQFAESCYLQGCEDMAMCAIKEQPQPVDYQI